MAKEKLTVLIVRFEQNKNWVTWQFKMLIESHVYWSWEEFIITLVISFEVKFSKY